MYICGIDPGTNFIGITLIEIDDEINIKDIKIELLNLSNENDELLIRLLKLYRFFKNYFKDKLIFYLGIESAFMYSRKPQAFGPLSQAIILIKKAFIDLKNDYKRIIDIAPLSVKYKINKNKKLDKDSLKNSLLKIDEIKKFNIPDNLTDHEYDSLGIAYYLYLSLKEKPELLLF